MTSQGLQDSTSLLIPSTAREAWLWSVERGRQMSKLQVSGVVPEGSGKVCSSRTMYWACPEHPGAIAPVASGFMRPHPQSGWVCLELEMGEVTGYYFLPASIKLIQSFGLSWTIWARRLGPCPSQTFCLWMVSNVLGRDVWAYPLKSLH